MPQTKAERIVGSTEPNQALVKMLEKGLEDAGFRVVDTKPHGLLVQCNKTQIMIGIQEVQTKLPWTQSKVFG